MGLVRCGFLNIEGLIQKISNGELQEVLKDYEILCLAETWLDPKRKIDIKGYRCFRKEKLKNKKFGRHPGGLMILVHERFKGKVSEIKSVLEEIIWLRVEGKKESPELIIGGCYSHPVGSEYYNENFWSLLKNDVEGLRDDYVCAEIVIMGDLNARIGERKVVMVDNLFMEESVRRSKDRILNREGGKLLEFCESLGLEPLNGRSDLDPEGQFTFINQNGGSVIDYVIVSYNLAGRVEKFEIEDKSTSHHMMLTAWFRWDDEPVEEERVKKGEFKGIMKIIWQEDKGEEFHKLLSDDISELMRIGIEMDSAADINRAAVVLNNCIMRAGGSMRRKDRVNKGERGWFNVDCNSRKKRYRQCYRKWRKYDKEEDRREYIKVKNEYRETLKITKAEYEAKEINKLKIWIENRDLQKAWECINKWTRSRYSMNRIEGGTWVRYFTELFKNMSTGEGIKEVEQPFLREYIRELDQDFTEEEVKRIVKSSKNKVAAGWDGIPNKCWKELIKKEKWVGTLTKLLNKIKDCGNTPENWKSALMVPIYKNKGAIDSPENYRGISLLPSLSKMYTGMLAIRLKCWLEEAGIISIFQAGFRSKKRTSDNIFIIKTLTEKYISKKRGKIFWGFIDFEKAFDTISREQLWFKMKKCGISARFIEKIKGIYSGINFKVKLADGGLSENIWSNRGLRQGCKLSPFLFNIFINDVIETLGKREFHCPVLMNKEIPAILFADDIAIGAVTAIGLQRALDELSRYSREWNLKVNINKTKILVCKNGGVASKKEKWFLNNEQIEVVDKFKYLGVWLNTRGNWAVHKLCMKKQGFLALNSIDRCLRKLANIKFSVLNLIYKSLVESRIFYGIEIWGDESVADIINKVRTRYGKKILGIPRNSANVAVRMEMGIENGLSIVLIRRIKFIQHILETPEDSLERACLEYIQSAAIRDNWWNKGVEMVNKIGMGWIWNRMGDWNVNIIAKLIRKRCNDILKQELGSDLDHFKSLEDFKNIKSGWGMETYVYKCSSKIRYGLAWMRLGIWKLKNFRGNYPRDMCPLCMKVENARHILLECLETDEWRKTFISSKYLRMNKEVAFKKLCITSNLEVIQKIGMYLFLVRNKWKKKVEAGMTLQRQEANDDE